MCRVRVQRKRVIVQLKICKFEKFKSVKISINLLITNSYNDIISINTKVVMSEYGFIFNI